MQGFLFVLKLQRNSKIYQMSKVVEVEFEYCRAQVDGKDQDEAVEAKDQEGVFITADLPADTIAKPANTREPRSQCRTSAQKDMTKSTIMHCEAQGLFQDYR